MMMMMKSSITLMACILLLSSLAVQAYQNSFGPDECCFKFYSGTLYKRRVVSYKNTDNMCPLQGVLFTMKSGSQVCVDPSVQWVKDIIEAKDKIQAAKASSPESTTKVSN